MLNIMEPAGKVVGFVVDFNYLNQFTDFFIERVKCTLQPCQISLSAR